MKKYILLTILIFAAGCSSSGYSDYSAQEDEDWDDTIDYLEGLQQQQRMNQLESRMLMLEMDNY